MKIVVSESDGFSDAAADRLRQAGELVLADVDRPGLLAAVRDADVVWVRLRHRIDAEVIAAAPKLKMIVTSTTGLNHIDLDEAGGRGIRVVSLQGETEFLKDVRATAEHTVGLMLALLRQIPAATAHVSHGGWDRDRFKGRELFGKTVGVVGYGRLGRVVARYLRAFDARVLAADPASDAGSVEPEVTLVSLEQLLPQAEIVTLHVNLSPGTQGFFTREMFEAMREGAWFVNTSRGELVDEAALVGSLRSGRLAGAALDVLAGEDSGGMRHHPLVAYAAEHSNLLITPHVGGCTLESMEKTEMFLAGRVRDALGGR